MPYEAFYFFSSNVQPRYLSDSLRSLMLPRGAIVHYRYRSKYISQEVRQHIHKDKRSLVGIAACLFYLHRTQAGGPDGHKQLTFRKCFPLRLGTIVDINDAGSVLHFYFALAGYASPAGADTVVAKEAWRLLMGAQISSSEPILALRGSDLLPDQFSTPNEDGDAFSKIVDAFKSSDFETYDPLTNNNFQYDPVFCRVTGVYPLNPSGAESDQSLQPNDCFSKPHDRVYDLRSDAPQGVRVSYYQAGWSGVPASGLSIKCDTDERVFTNPNSVSLEMTSFYDEQTLYLVPKPTLSGWLSRLSILIPVDSPTQVRQAVRIIAPSWNCWFRSFPLVNPTLRKVIGAISRPVPVLAIVASLMVGVTSRSGSSPPSWAWSLLIGSLIAYLILLTISGFINESAK